MASLPPSIPVFPLFPGLPGGPELLIVLLVMVLLLGVPVVVLAAGAFLGVRLFGGQGDGEDGKDERIAELEREVRDLRERLDEEQD